MNKAEASAAFDSQQTKTPAAFDSQQTKTLAAFDSQQTKTPAAFDHQQTKTPAAFDHQQTKTPAAFDHQQTKTPAAFIFDLDGVLVHSMPLHVLAWEEYLAGMGISVEDLERRMHGKRNAELVSDLIAKELPKDVVFRHGAAKEQLWRDMLVREGVEKYQIAGLVDFLELYRDIPKAIASNAEPQNIDFVLEQYRLRKYFPVAVNGFDVERGKPAPDIYLEAARRLKVKPQDCIVFEDSPTGLEAAVAAGMRVVGVATTTNDLPGAELVIHDFRDERLAAWLASAVTIPKDV